MEITQNLERTSGGWYRLVSARAIDDYGIEHCWWQRQQYRPEPPIVHVESSPDVQTRRRRKPRY